MDENFLLQKARSLALLELMRRHEKSWALYVFSSANALRQYTMEELVGLGISWVWMGLEGQDSQYGKLNGIDTRALVRELQENGIRVLGSSIIGLEEHTPQNIEQAISYAVSHDTDFHQFMLYTAVAGTPLHRQLGRDGTLLGTDEISFEDTHGQWRFNFRHKHIPAGRETDYLLGAFEEDFRVNGPSVLRVARSVLKGYRRHRNHPERRIRKRFGWEAEGMCLVYPGAVWAAQRYFKDNAPLVARLGELLDDIKQEFGLAARILAPLVGRIILHKLRREAAKLAAGWTQDPPTFYQHNYARPGMPTETRVRSVSGLATVDAQPQPAR
jgi:hypothetical protein